MDDTLHPLPLSTSEQEKIHCSGKSARRIMEKLFSESSITDLTNEYPKFQKTEIVFGKTLGKGGFGTVSEIRAFDIENQTEAKSGQERAPSGDECKLFLAEHCIRDGGDSRYAIKCMRKDIITKGGERLYLQGLIDMAIEARFLSSIAEHTNIVKIRGRSTSNYWEDGFFLIMDRLYDTLDSRLYEWRSREMPEKSKRGLSKLLSRKKDAINRRQALMEERLVAACDLSSAYGFLHAHKIVYRDIKPQNIGFNVHGEVKIFDFGLAKELRENKRNTDGTYELTGMTGTLYFMAPEVFLRKPYNESCDVYSFALLLWQILALDWPFLGYSKKKFHRDVFLGQERPKINEAWSASIKELLKQCWADDWKKRYSFRELTAVLGREVVRAQDANPSGIHSRSRRRHTPVFPNGTTLSESLHLLSVHSIAA